MNSQAPKTNKAPRKIVIFFVAMFGVILIYAGFFLKCDDVVFGFIERRGISGIVVATLALLVLSIGAGIWAVACKLPNMRSAITTGMAFPGLIFGFGLAAGDSEVQQALLFPLGLTQAEEPGLLSDAVGLVFRPVASVVKHRVEPYKQKVDKLEKDVEELPRVRVEVNDLKQELEVLEKDVAALPRIREQVNDLKQEIEDKNTSYDEVKLALEQREEKVNNLTQNLDEAQFALSRERERANQAQMTIERVESASFIQQERAQEMEKSLTYYKDQLERAGKFVNELIAHSGSRVIPALTEVAEKTDDSSVRVKAIRHLGDIPEAKQDDRVNRILKRFEKSPDRKVKDAVKGTKENLGIR